MRVVLLQPPPGRRHQWPVMMLIVVFTLGSLLYRAVTDVPPVQAPPDLDPPEPVFTGQWRDTISTNGWAYLSLTLENDAAKQLEEDETRRAAARSGPRGVPVIRSVRNPSETFRDILAKKTPWDGEVVEEFRRGGVITEAVEEALRKPEFRPAASPPFTQLWRWVVTRLEADFAMALRLGDTDRARRCVSGLVRLSALILRETQLVEDYDLAEGQRDAAARMTFELLTAAPLNRPLAAALLEDWSTEAPEAEAAVRRLARSTLDQRRMTDGIRESAKSHPGLRSRPNRTARLLMAEARRIQDGGLPTVPSREASPGGSAVARYTLPFPWLLDADSNHRGLTFDMASWAENFAEEEYGVSRGNLFRTRAMRTALAVWLWRVDHGGRLPATLAELTPGYLKTAQEDPWIGGPLGWDPAKETISAAGANHSVRSRGRLPGDMDLLTSPARVRLPENTPPSPPP